MLTFFSLLLVLIGSLNWLSIGVLQFDFVAGIFGSQANIFSRLIYTIIGIGAVVFTVLLIKNKGKVKFSFKKAQEDMQDMTAKKATANAEADSDKTPQFTTLDDYNNKYSGSTIDKGVSYRTNGNDYEDNRQNRHEQNNSYDYQTNDEKDDYTKNGRQEWSNNDARHEQRNHDDFDM